MTYILKSSLEKRALVKIASVLWSQSDINAELDKLLLLRSFDAEENFKELEEKILQKIEKFPEIGKFKDKISGFVKSMGCQIFNWICDHSISNIAEKYDIRVHTPSFSWTLYGTIDKKETARNMINDKTLDPATRYKLAHIYCLEGNVQEVWDSIPSDCKDPVYETRDNPGVINEYDLVVFWSNALRSSSIVYAEALASCRRAFQLAVQNGSEVAAAYFLQKLSQKEKDICLVPAAQYAPDVEVLCLLLSQMDEDQRWRVFQINPEFILEKFDEWPWVTLYLETAKYYWQASKDKYCLYPLIFFIRMTGMIGYEKVAFQKIFTDLWQCISKGFGTDVNSSTELLRTVFLVNNKPIINMIFRDASPAIKKTFIEDSPEITMQLIEKNDRELFQFLIQECLLSQNEIRKFKKKLEFLLSVRETGANYKSVADKIDKFFYTLESGCVKRKSKWKRRSKRLCKEKGK